MIILSNSGGVAMTNCFLVADESTKHAVLFDAPDHTTDRLLKETTKRGWDLIGLWLTHGHFDHFADHALVKQHFPAAKILIHPLEEPKAQNPVTVIHTPGHAPGHVSYHFPSENLLIGGDLIIAGSVGRTDLPDSDHAALEASIRRIMQLPPKTRLLGGHGPATTLEHERKTNPFVQEALQHSARG